jgi:16S rRNA (uracil1498-N3)-methyltransferase
MRRLPVSTLTSGSQPVPAELELYVRRVLRASVGDVFLLVEGKHGATAQATVTALDPLLIDVESVRVSTEVRVSCTWIHGLPKGEKADAIVRDATELGAETITFVRMTRSIPNLSDKRAEARVERWRKIAREAARQCERSTWPEIEMVDDFRCLGLRLQGAVLLHERMGEPLLDILLRQEVSVFLAGPEGGFTDEEVAYAIEQGATATTLGPRILRTETVPAAVLGARLVLEPRFSR